MKPVLRGVGFLLHVPALMALGSLVICAIFGEWYGVGGFLLTAGASLLLGQALFWINRGATTTQRHHTMSIAALTWVLVSLLAAIPLLWSAYAVPGGAAARAMSVFRSPPQALFEAVSGFTSTGLTLALHASDLPAHIQWWRSFMQWVGGIGVIVLLLTVLPAERGSLYLYYSEAREEKILPTVQSTVRAIWILFLGYTVLAVAALWLAGEPFWRALNHGMTGIATGGFTITDDSLASIPAPVQLVYVPIMVLGMINFTVHYRVVREGRFREALWTGAEIRLFWALLIGGGVVLTLERYWFTGSMFWVDSLLQWVSALSTTGFASADLGSWRPGPLLLLIFAMLIGAMGGSTGGGIKQARVAILLRDLRANIAAFRHTPHEVVRIRYDGRRLHPDTFAAMSRTAGMLVGAWLLVWVAGSVALLHFVPDRIPLVEVLFEVASAQGGVGISTGITGPGMGAGALLVLIAVMLLGRLEIFPLLVLIVWIFRGR